MKSDLLDQPASPPTPGATSRPAESLPTVPATLHPRKKQPEEDHDEPSFLQRYRVLGVVAICAVAGLVYAFSRPSVPSTSAPVRKAAVPINIQLPPPPLPPPPPPPPPKMDTPPPQDQMEEQAPVVEDTPPAPEPDNSPPPIGTNITGNGPADGFGLGKATGGTGNGTGRRVGGGGSRFGYYASQVQSRIGSAIRRNPRTKSATMALTAKIWADDTGRITRAVLSGSSGDPAVDAALREEVLTGLQLESPPPAGMKMPINLRLTARPGR